MFLIPSTTKTQCENLVNFLQLRFYVKSNQLRQLQSFKSYFTKLISRKILSCRKNYQKFSHCGKRSKYFFPSKWVALLWLHKTSSPIFLLEFSFLMFVWIYHGKKKRKKKLFKMKFPSFMLENSIFRIPFLHRFTQRKIWELVVASNLISIC